MQQWIIDNIFTIISTIFGGSSLVAFFFERNKRRIEERQLNADALTKMQEAYSIYTTDSNNRYDKLKQEFEEEFSRIKKKLNTVVEELDKERVIREKITAENILLKRENEILNKELDVCKEKF